jgi:hypothetical protein
MEYIPVSERKSGMPQLVLIPVIRTEILGSQHTSTGQNHDVIGVLDEFDHVIK